MTDKTECGWAIVGTGGIATRFAGDLAHVAGARRRAVVSRSQATADAFAAKHGFETGHDRLEAVLGDGSVDAVYLATPHPQHRDAALAAIAAGKAVLIEKPITMTARDALMIDAAARKARVLVMEAMWSRFLPAVQRARALIDSGALGTVRRAEASLHFHRPFDPDHRLFSRALGGGVLHDLGVYPISVAAYLLGTPVFESGAWQAAPTGVDRQARLAMLCGGSQVPVTISVGFEASMMNEGNNTLTVYGSDKTLRIDRHFLRADAITLWPQPMDHAPKARSLAERLFKRLAFDGRRRETYDKIGTGLNYQTAAFQAALGQGWQEHPVMPVRESAAVLTVIEAVLAQSPSL